MKEVLLDIDDVLEDIKSMILHNLKKVQGGTKKTGTFEKTQQKLKKSKKKKMLLTEIETLLLAF